MSPKFEPALRVEPAPSLLLKRAIWSLHVATLPAAWANGLPLWGKILLSVCILAHLRRGLTRHCDERRFASLRHEHGRGWALGLGNGSEVRVQIRSSSVIQRWFCLLHLETAGDGARYHWLILRDSLSAEDFRKLRVTLRLHALQGVAPAHGRQRC